MYRDISEIAEDLEVQAQELQQTEKQIDAARSMLACSWEGEASDELERKLWDLMQEIDHTGTGLRIISDSLEEKVIVGR